MIWAGTDDGLVHVTRDDGKTWQNVTPKGMPEWIQINAIDASPHDKGTAYVAATMYKLDDFRPYLYKTTDYGKTWTKIVNGIPDGAFTRVVREDPVRRGPALRRHRDRALRLVRRRRELAAVPAQPAGRADHGPRRQERRPRRRDAGPLVLDPRRPDAAAPVERRRSRTRAAYLFPPRPTVRMQTSRAGGEDEAPRPAGKNPPAGVVVDYWLKDKPEESEKVDARVPRRRHGPALVLEREAAKAEDAQGAGRARRGATRTRQAARAEGGPQPVRLGHADPKPSLAAEGGSTRGEASGPKVAPGTYTVRLKLGDADARRSRSRSCRTRGSRRRRRI